jgi:uncharacterized membrane protein
MIADSQDWEEPDRRVRRVWLGIALVLLTLQLVLAGMEIWLGSIVWGVVNGLVVIVACALFLRFGPFAKRRS